MLHGHTELQFAARGARTVLTASCAALPLQVQRPRGGVDGRAIVSLLTPAGALFSGDTVQVTVRCGPGTRVDLVQPTATKLNRCPDAPIAYRLEARVAAGACFRYLPRELIPGADTVYRQQVLLELEHGATAMLAEIVTPGRSYERFQYGLVELRTEVRLDGQLLAVDLLPLRSDGATSLGGYTHLGSLWYCAPGVVQETADRVHVVLQRPPLCGSASLLPTYGLTGRVLGRRAEHVHQGLVDALATASLNTNH